MLDVKPIPFYCHRVHTLDEPLGTVCRQSRSSLVQYIHPAKEKNKPVTRFIQQTKKGQLMLYFTLQDKQLNVRKAACTTESQEQETPEDL